MMLPPRCLRALRAMGLIVPSLLGAQWADPSHASPAPPAAPLTGLQHVVITAAEIRRRNVRTLDVLFEGAVPGIIAVGPGTDRSTIWRSRGLASPSLPGTPRVYLNGVEVAASSVASISPDLVDSVVAYPGAAAGAFAGPGAGGGVVYVYTKRGRKSSPPTMSGKTSGGTDRSLYGGGSPRFQDHVVELSGGDSATTYYLGGGLNSEGDWAPSYSDRLRHGLASLTTGGGYGTISAFGLSQREMTTSAEPSATFGPVVTPYIDGDTARVTAYGASAALALRSWWTLDVSGGVYDTKRDGESAWAVTGGPQDTVFSRSDTARRRTSYTAATAIHLPRFVGLQPSLLGGFERARFRYEMHESYAASRSALGDGGTWQRTDYVYQGYSAALGLRAGDVFTFTGGARREILVGSGIVDKAVWLPRFDAALVLPTPVGRATLRGAYGRVAPRAVPGEPTAGPSYAPITPSEQKGYEWGFDLAGPSRGAGVTLFTQEGRDRRVIPDAASVPSLGIVVRDASAVTNTGTSAYAYASRGPIAVRTEYSALRSKARTLDTTFVVSGYDPDALLAAFPNTAGHAAVIYTTLSGATLSTDVRYAGAYRNRDFRTAGTPFMRYPAFVTYDLDASFPLADAESFIVYAHNLANVERYDATSVHSAHGRRLGVGVRFGVR